MDYEVRALELHSLYAWDFPFIRKMMDFMHKHALNTLVLHRNDFIDLIVYPSAYFGAPKKAYHNKYDRYNEIFRKLYRYTPTRRSSPVQRYAFLKRVLQEAGRRGIAVYVENKELYFPEVLLEFYPFLVHEGAICANDPFWWEFTRVKYTDFFEEFPQVAGIIVSPGTGESRVSINSNRCTCERCQKATKREWYENLLQAMYDVLHPRGKTLVIRDFVFDPQAQAELAQVMEHMPQDVVLSLKNTPHDYYPTFPENPRIGQVGRHRQWLEFDCMGQYYGWGVGIADLTEDFRARLKSAREKGASGAIFRTDWESLDGQTAFYTPNVLNHYAGARLCVDLDTPSEEIYRAYLEGEGWFVPGAQESAKRAATSWFAGISSKTWGITSRIPYVDRCVFSDSSLTPLGLEHAYWLSEEKNSLRDWEPAKWEALYPTKENLLRAVREKDDALRGICALRAAYEAQRPSALREEKYEDYRERLYVMQRYAQFYRAAVHAIVYTRYLLQTEEERNGVFYGESLQRGRAALAALREECGKAQEFYQSTAFAPHVIYTLMDPDRLDTLYRNLAAHLEQGGISLQGVGDSVGDMGKATL